jgi:hypothetical protein
MYPVLISSAIPGSGGTRSNRKSITKCTLFHFLYCEHFIRYALNPTFHFYFWVLFPILEIRIEGVLAGFIFIRSP